MSTLTKNKQLIYLFLCNFSILFIGFGLFPLLPLYAAEFGASASFIGFYLAVTYIAISVGSILAG
jgi:predicted MFS family arabinose efflux permease